jgi:Protein of unknown function (DUF3352)
MTRKEPQMLRATSLAALALLAALVGACGGGSAGDSGADPATAVPSDAPFYLEVTVRPEGDLSEDTLAAAGKVLQTPDPQARIRELVDQVFSSMDGPQLSYERDIAPWLGERAGLWLTAGEGSDPTGAALLAATDTERAQEALDTAFERSGEETTPRTHREVDYVASDDGDAAGVVGDFVVLGTEAGVKRTIDALEGDSIGDNDRYRDAVDGLDDGRLAHVYADVAALARLGSAGDPQAEEQLRQFEQIVPLSKLGPVTGAFFADGDRLAMDFEMNTDALESLGPVGALSGATSTPLVGELPGDAWFASGSPDFGQAMRTMLDQYAGLFGGAVAQEQIRRELGIDLEQDVFSWVGDVAFFVRGSDMATLDGGAVIEVTDSSRAEAAFGKLVGALRTSGGLDAQPIRIEGAEVAYAAAATGAPRPIVLARSDDRVVVTYGEEAAAEALQPADKLADSELYGRARGALGDTEPTFLLSMPGVISLVEATGSADASFEQARPYLEAFGFVAMGGSRDDDRAHVRVAAGLE